MGRHLGGCSVTLASRFDALERVALPAGLTLLIAGDRRSRRRGLAHLDADALPAGWGLGFERCRSVHTIGMRFALDLVWVDARGEVLRVDAAVGGWRLQTCLAARGVVETAAGEGERFAAALAAAGWPVS